MTKKPFSIWNTPIWPHGKSLADLFPEKLPKYIQFGDHAKLRELVETAWKNSGENGYHDYLRSLSLRSVACDMVDGDKDIGDLSGTPEYPDDEALLEALEKILPEIMK